MKTLKKVLTFIIVALTFAIPLTAQAASGLNQYEQALIATARVKLSETKAYSDKDKASFLNQANNYFMKDHVEVTKEQHDQIMAIVGPVKGNDLTKQQKYRLIEIARQMVSVFDMKLSYDPVDKVATVYDDKGNIVVQNSTIIKKTGNSARDEILLSLCAICAFGAGAVMYKKHRKSS